VIPRRAVDVPHGDFRLSTADSAHSREVQLLGMIKQNPIYEIIFVQIPNFLLT
jgi:hypothetical protein